MPFTRHLSPERIFELHAAALALDRMALLGGMDAAFIATLPDLPNGTPSDRLLATLHRLNAVETLGDGSVPMRSWLLNARSLARGRGETDEEAFVDALAALGKPSSPPRAKARGSREERKGDPRAAEIRRLSKQREEQVAKGLSADEITSAILRLKRAQRTGPDLAAGDTLSDGRYELVEHLGKGGVGTVWKAHDHETGASVAVKFLLADEGPHVLDRFRRGARCMAKLNHPNVVRVVQAASVEEIRGNERWFFVMELLAGGTLYQRVLQGRWDRDRALRAVVEAGFGLSCAHQEKMIHRDVSPDNILIDHEGRAKLTDFDLVKAEDTTGLTKTNQPMGKTFYMAPEVFDGAKHADARSDVFALGRTALFVAYGKPLRYAVIGERERFFAKLDCPEAIKAVLDKATDNEPEERYASVAELCAAIEGAMRKEVLAEPPASVPGSEPAPSTEPPASAPLYNPNMITVFEQPTASAPPAPQTPSALPSNFTKPLPHEAPAPSEPSLVVVPLLYEAPVPSASDSRGLDVGNEPLPYEASAPSASDSRGLDVDNEVVPLPYEAPAPSEPSQEVVPSPAERPQKRRLLRFGSGFLLLAGGVTAGIKAQPQAMLAHPGMDVALQPPSVFCLPGMTLIPGGTFWMGSAEDDKDADSDELPRHEVKLDAFCLDKTEVTVNAFKPCATSKQNDAQCGPVQVTVEWSNYTPDDVKLWSKLCTGNKPDHGDHPINCVDWTQADTYCRWAGKRLPTEAEWERAARGGDDRKYPWGDDKPDKTKLNACGKECREMGAKLSPSHWAVMYEEDDGYGATAPVGKFPPNPYELLDMAGNVWEWTADWYAPYEKSKEVLMNPKGPDKIPLDSTRVLRGGGWGNSDPSWVRAAFRGRIALADRYYFVGFRCASGLIP